MCKVNIVKFDVHVKCGSCDHLTRVVTDELINGVTWCSGCQKDIPIVHEAYGKPYNLKSTALK